MAVFDYFFFTSYPPFPSKSSMMTFAQMFPISTKEETFINRTEEIRADLFLSPAASAVFRTKNRKVEKQQKNKIFPKKK